MIWTIILGLSCTSGSKGISYILKAVEVCWLQWLHQHSCLGKTLISLINSITSVSHRKRFFPGASMLPDDTQRMTASPLALLIHPVFPWRNLIHKTSFLEQGKIVVLNGIWWVTILFLEPYNAEVHDGCWSTLMDVQFDFWKCCAYPPVFCRLLWGDLSATGGSKGPTKNSWPLYLHTTVCLVVTFLFNRTKTTLEIRSQNSVGGKRPLEVCNPLLLPKV